MIRFFQKNKIIRAVRRQYPILANIDIEYTGPNQLVVLVDFHDPQLIIKHKTRRFAIYNNENFELFS